MLRITLSYLLLALLSTSIAYFFIYRASKKQRNTPASIRPSDLRKKAEQTKERKQPAVIRPQPK